MVDILKDFEIDDIVKDSLIIREMVLEKIMSKKHIFMIGDKESLSWLIEYFDLDVEPLQLYGDNILKLKTDSKEFLYTYFVRKDEHLRRAIETHGCENPKNVKLDLDLLIGIELIDTNLSSLSFKKGEEFNVKNTEKYINIVFPIPNLEDINEFNKRTNEIIGYNKNKIRSKMT